MTGVVSLAVLLAGVGSAPWVPSSVAVTVATIWVTPAGTGLITWTAKITKPFDAPGARVPIPRVQFVPAGEPLGQLHAPLLLPRSKIVLAGTVTASVTPVALAPPVFWTINW